MPWDTSAASSPCPSCSRVTQSSSPSPWRCPSPAPQWSSVPLRVGGCGFYTNGPHCLPAWPSVFWGWISQWFLSAAPLLPTYRRTHLNHWYLQCGSSSHWPKDLDHRSMQRPHHCRRDRRNAEVDQRIFSYSVNWRKWRHVTDFLQLRVTVSLSIYSKRLLWYCCVMLIPLSLHCSRCDQSHQFHDDSFFPPLTAQLAHRYPASSPYRRDVYSTAGQNTSWGPFVPVSTDQRCETFWIPPLCLTIKHQVNIHPRCVWNLLSWGRLQSPVPLQHISPNPETFPF